MKNLVQLVNDSKLTEIREEIADTFMDRFGEELTDIMLEILEKHEVELQETDSEEPIISYIISGVQIANYEDLDRVPTVSREITLDEMVEWFKVMAKIGLSFHPDDEPSEIVDDSGKNVFTAAEVDRINALMPLFFETHGDKVYDVAFDAMQSMGSE